jgi:multicomponent Na+:H+ antiporter subunit D
MVAGVGIGTEMAINGTTAHAFSHILYKSLLFMGAGAVIYATGKSKLTELGGFAKKMPVVVGLYMIGAFSISGFPLFNGFISKSMVVSAAGGAHFPTVMLLLILASVGTFLHTGLKLPYFTWFGEKKTEFSVSDVPLNMKIAMGMGAFFCTLFGVYPDLLYNYLPYSVGDYEPYTIYHLVEMMQILVFTFVGFWLLRKKLEGTPHIALDTDWFYRKPADAVRYAFVQLPDRLFGFAEQSTLKLANRLSQAAKNPLQVLPFSSEMNGKPVNSDDFAASIGAALAFILLGFIVASLVVLL